MSSVFSVFPSTADVKAVGVASVQFDVTLAFNDVYIFSTTTTCWLTQGANPTAVAGTDGNWPVSPGDVIELRGRNGAKVAVIQATAGGFAALARGYAVNPG